ncbi:MAG: DUF4325 domain-containing protein [Propionicimonas sp.]|nr:DUF4325 domain-containing protein [Propionicimonas sp.]
MNAVGDPLVWQVPDLRSPNQTSQLVAKVREQGNRRLVLDLTKTGAVYPNGAVPFAATLAYLMHERSLPIELRFAPGSQLEHILTPLTLDGYVRGDATLTNSVWMYGSEADAQRLTSMFMDALTDQVACEEGVIDSINWCLYEVLDNVFQHSQADTGYVMMQLHREHRRCAVAVADTGIGIQKSLALTRAADLDILRDPGASIDHSLKKGVTSKGGENQGNGLFGLRRAVEINGGWMNIRSGWGDWALRDGQISFGTDRTRPLADSEDHQSTLVDWQLDCSTKVRIDEALGSRVTMSSEFLESIEDESGVHRVSVREIEESLGSRKLGAEIRTRLVNYLSAGARFVVLDFKGVGVVSSSFADEVLAKLAASLGELEYRRRVFIESASDTNRALIETAVSTRLGFGERPEDS